MAVEIVYNPYRRIRGTPEIRGETITGIIINSPGYICHDTVFRGLFLP